MRKKRSGHLRSCEPGRGSSVLLQVGEEPLPSSGLRTVHGLPAPCSGRRRRLRPCLTADTRASSILAASGRRHRALSLGRAASSLPCIAPPSGRPHRLRPSLHRAAAASRGLPLSPRLAATAASRRAAASPSPASGRAAAAASRRPRIIPVPGRRLCLALGHCRCRLAQCRVGPPPLPPRRCRAAAPAAAWGGHAGRGEGTASSRKNDGER
jgi:hypothetical protein